MILAVTHGCWYDFTQISARGNLPRLPGRLYLRRGGYLTLMAFPDLSLAVDDVLGTGPA
jgi:hypothetical protein